MNAKDIYREVSAMISQGVIESEAALRASLNRALDEIGRLYPRKQFLTLRQMGRHSVFRLLSPREVRKESPLTVSAVSCREIAFKGTGRGEVVLTWGGKLLHKQALEGAPFSFCQTLSSLGAVGEAELLLLFRSESGMVLEELFLYDNVASSVREREGIYNVYRMAKELPSFISFTEERYKNRLPIAFDSKEVRLCGDCVWIDSAASGIYEIGCYAAPKAVTKENEGETLDLSAELLFLVPLLTAYYACVEMEDGRAEDFLKRYQQARREFRNTARFTVNEMVEDVRGW